jgi:hypothetical protein
VRSASDILMLHKNQELRREGPKRVRAAPRLASDMEALKELLAGDVPRLKRVRCRVKGQAFYGFGDASGSSFGASFQIGDEIDVEYGQWCTEVTEVESSNWREANNLVEHLERIVKKHNLRGVEIFLFKDNTTAEAAFWKGHLTSRKLFEIVLRLKKLEMDYDILLQVIYVSGKRMIHQGTDGLSRADRTTGVLMQGIRMEEFVPLHLNGLDRSSKLRGWLDSVLEGLAPTFLITEGWFGTGHGAGTYVWAPAPAAAEVVVEQLGKAQLKRPQAMHLIVVPRLMTGRWRRHLTRGSDFYFRVEWEDVWPIKEHFEPLLIFVCFPYQSASPRSHRKARLLDKFRGSLLQEDVSALSGIHRRHLLRELFQSARQLCPL